MSLKDVRVMRTVKLKDPKNLFNGRYVTIKIIQSDYSIELNCTANVTVISSHKIFISKNRVEEVKELIEQCILAIANLHGLEV